MSFKSVHIRKANKEDVPGIAKVNVDSWRTTYKDIVPLDFLESLSYEKAENRFVERINNPDTFIYVAQEKSGGIVGYAMGGSNRQSNIDYKGELYAVYLLVDFQHKGIGKKLVAAIASGLMQNKMDSMIVIALEQNVSACAFYESLRGQKVGEGSIELGGILYKEIIYGWENIVDLRTL